MMLRALILCLVSLAVAQDRLFSSAFGYPGRKASYDYIVIGGGTAGLTLASRLAASTASVAVVEAGGFYEVENGNNSVVPLLSLTGIAFIDPSPEFTPQPLMDWSLVSEPIPGVGGRRVHYAQGKTLGRSSAINTMSWENMLKYFKRSVDLTPPNEEKRQNTNASVRFDLGDYDEGGGPLQVSWNNWVDPTPTWLAQVLLSLGLSISLERFSSATKILFNGTKAVGVSVNSQGVEYTLSAHKEVILTASTFHSPQLLQLSGIGSRGRLEALSIPVIADIPGVGQIFQDPIQIFVAYPVSTPSTQSLTNNPALNLGFVEEYLKFGTRPYSSAAGFLAHERLPNSTLANLTGTLAAYLPRVFSRGNVTVSSASIDAKPVINLNWLSDSADIELAVTAVKRLRTAWASTFTNSSPKCPRIPRRF
ncbi:hypothetical protein SGCOL_005624 [Colletotrichum sp. CLE4]